MENYNAYYTEITTLKIGRRELFQTKNNRVYNNKKDIPKTEKFDISFFEIYIINDNAANYSNYLKSLLAKAITEILCLNNESKKSFFERLKYIRNTLEDFYSDIAKYLKNFKDDNKILSSDIDFAVNISRTYNVPLFALNEVQHSFLENIRQITNYRIQSLREGINQLYFTISKDDVSIFKKCSYLEVIDINQWWLGYIKMQFENQLTPTLYHPENPTKKMYGIEDMMPKLRLVNFEIASEIPFFNLSEFRVAVRGILLSTADKKTVQSVLKTVFKFSEDVIDLYNKEISNIEKNSGIQRKNERDGKENKDELPIVTERMSLRIDEDRKAWIVNDTSRFYRNNPKTFFNRDFAIFAANVYNFLKEDIFTDKEKEVLINEDNVEDEITSFEDLFYDSNNIIPCIKVLSELEKPVLNHNFEWVGNNKSILCIWIREMVSKRFSYIKHTSNKDYARLLLTRFPDLKSFSHTNFDKGSPRANNYKLEIRDLLSQVSVNRK